VLVILTSILILGVTVLISSFQSQGSPPEIPFEIDFPKEILANGEKTQSFVFFKDSDQDIVQIGFKLTKPYEAESLNFDPQVKGKLSGVIKFSIAATSPPLELEICVGEEEQCKKIRIADSAPAEVSLSITLVDEAGNESEPRKFSFKVEAGERPNQPPVAKFTYSPTEPKVGETVTFDAADSQDPDGKIIGYNWDFGDGSTAQGTRVSHSYSSARTYTVKLTVTDNGGLTNSTTQQVTVHPKPQPPMASFTYSPSQPKVGESVSFDASSSSDPDGSIVKYEWNFGDGGTGSGRIAYHSYSSARSYTVTLKVTDNDGLTNSTSKAVTVVAPPPVADFTASPTSGVAPLTVRFTNTSRGEITSYAWDFGDGSTSTEKNPQHTYRNPGSYSVSLTVRGPGGQDTKRRPNLITVSHPHPVARFTASPTSGSAPLTVRFTNLSQNYTTSYWSFGDGSTSTETNPVHTYWAMGSYTVRLTVRGPGGEASASQVITVLLSPSGLLYQDDFRNPSSGWCVGRDALHEYGYQNGEYSITVKRPHWLYWCWAPREHSFPEDFIVEVDAGQVSGPSGEYGIIWGKDSDNFYMFAVSTDSRYGMWKQVRDAWQPDPVGWTANSAINRGTGRNRLRLIVKGGTIMLMANDVVLQTVTAPSFGRGRIGLFVGTFDSPGVEVHFDNFKVYSVP
jgi:PKD repeat protein